MTDHPTSELDTTIHQPTRLGILTVLSEAASADFTYLLSTLELTPGNLSRHLTVLEEGGLVVIRKKIENRKPRTWISITKKGKDSLRREIDSLRRLIGLVDGASQSGR